MNESLKDVWKNPEIIDWLDRGPLHETRHSLSAICPMITQSLNKIQSIGYWMLLVVRAPPLKECCTKKSQLLQIDTWELTILLELLN